MSTARKTILIAGLGPSISASSAETVNVDRSKVPNMVADEVRKATAGGFDCTNIVITPDDTAGGLERMKVQLSEQHFDGFSIGFGLRGVKENSGLFEEVVNTAIAASPETKLVFPAGPDSIWEAIQRVFGEA